MVGKMEPALRKNDMTRQRPFHPQDFYYSFGNALKAFLRIAEEKKYTLRGRVKYKDDRGWFVFRRFRRVKGGSWQQLTTQEGPYRIKYLTDRQELINIDGEVLVIAAGTRDQIPSIFDLRIPKTIRQGSKRYGNAKNTGHYYP